MLFDEPLHKAINGECEEDEEQQAEDVDASERTQGS